MHFLLALAISLGSLEGVVMLEDAPLPGCMVTLGERRAVTQVDGRYRFENVTPGKQELTFELDGLIADPMTVEVEPGVNAAPVAEMKIDPEPMTITFNCSSPCQDAWPQTKWERQACDDYDFDTALIETMERDRSAIALATRRFRDASTYRQKHRLAGALLGRAANDTPMWDELYEHAANAVRFPRVDGEYSQDFLEWCNREGVNPEEYEDAASYAFGSALEDPRARTLLHRALESADEALISWAVYGFAVQKDESALPAIDRALERHPDHAHWMASSLEAYASAAADAIAMKYMDEETRAVYLKQRALPLP
jgi:hypothetical protein